MKKWLISLAFFLAPLSVNSASLSIDNPVISQGTAIAVPGQASHYVFAFEQIASGSVTLTLEAMLTGAIDTVLDLNITTYLQNWSLSIIDQTQGVSTLLISNSIMDTQSLSISMLATSVYQLVFTGVTPLKHFSIEINEISKIPLPAAVWLFGSVLLGGVAVKRRRSARLHVPV